MTDVIDFGTVPDVGELKSPPDFTEKGRVKKFYVLKDGTCQHRIGAEGTKDFAFMQVEFRDGTTYRFAPNTYEIQIAGKETYARDCLLWFGQSEFAQNCWAGAKEDGDAHERINARHERLLEGFWAAEAKETGPRTGDLAAAAFEYAKTNASPKTKDWDQATWTKYVAGMSEQARKDFANLDPIKARVLAMQAQRKMAKAQALKDKSAGETDLFS